MSKKIHNSYVVPSSYHQKRKRFLKRMIREDKMHCYLCGQQDLTTLCADEKEIPDHRKATVDHIVPMYLYEGSYLDVANWAVCCLKCNHEKGGKV